jgi:integrase
MPSLIIKRGKPRYRATVTVKGVRDDKLFPDDSKDSFREAVLWEKTRKKELRALNSLQNMEFISIEFWILEYLDEVQLRFTQVTYKEKKSAFDRLVKVDALRPMTSVDRIDKQLAKEFLANQFRTRSGYAANKDRKNLVTAWRWGVENIPGWPQPTNPFKAVPKFPEIRSPRYVPPEQDFWKVYDVAGLPVRGIAGKQDQFMLLTMLHTAGRRKEIFQMVLEDLNFSTNMIRLWTRKRKGGNLEADWIPMTSILRKGLLEWIKIRPIKDTENLFVCLDGSSCNEAQYGNPFSSRQQLMRKLCKAAKVKAFGFHSIRHMTASILFVAGEPLWKIQGILRHKSPTTTERYLRTLGLESARDAMENNLPGPEVISSPKHKTPSEEAL